MNAPANIFACARRCLLARDVEQTLDLSEQGVADCIDVSKAMENRAIPDPELQPVFPDKPRLVDPVKLPRRGVATEAGRAALIHAIAHIEYNAVHLAWDAIYRFRNQPEAFYRDWLQVAGEETRHFRMLQTRLRELGHVYGDFDAHDGLWRVAYMTRHDPLIRMALVPRVLEARGLDVTPGMITRLENAGDTETADILRIIYRDEIGHVEIGSRWFHYFCSERNLDPEATFRDTIRE